MWPHWPRQGWERRPSTGESRHLPTGEVRRPTERCSRRGTPWTLRPPRRPTTALLAAGAVGSHPARTPLRRRTATPEPQAGRQKGVDRPRYARWASPDPPRKHRQTTLPRPLRARAPVRRTKGVKLRSRYPGPPLPPPSTPRPPRSRALPPPHRPAPYRRRSLRRPSPPRWLRHPRLPPRSMFPPSGPPRCRPQKRPPPRRQRRGPRTLSSFAAPWPRSPRSPTR